MLLVKDIMQPKINYNISFERFADDLIMISVINETHECEIPSYWRLTNSCGIPPLEIGVDCQNGLIISITFFINEIKAIESFADAELSLPGDVIVDASIFKKINDYIDIDQGYSVYITNSKLICSFGEVQKIANKYYNDRFELLIDKDNQIVGFSIGDLSENENEMLVSLEHIL